MRICPWWSVCTVACAQATSGPGMDWTAIDSETAVPPSSTETSAAEADIWSPVECTPGVTRTLAPPAADGTIEKMGPTPPLRIGEISALPGRSTPESLCVRLLEDVDRIAVRASLSDTGEAPVSTCQTQELYRIGPAAQTWAIGEDIALPLAYTEELPPGVYTQRVRVEVNAANHDFHGSESYVDFFEVDAAGLHPISSEEYSAIVTPTTIGPNGEVEYVGTGGLYGQESARVSDPCETTEPYTDRIEADAAISRIDLDAWRDAGTIQPFRWRRSIALPDGAPSGAQLEFQARDSGGMRLRWQIAVPGDEPAAFEGPVGSLQVIENAIDPNASWSATAGRVRISLDGATRLRVDFSDVVLEKYRMYTDPPVTRTLASGSIVGEWVLR